MSLKTRRWTSLFGSSKRTEAARQEARKRRGMRKLFMEPLEDRRLLAMVDGNGADLLLDLNTAGDAVTSVANGANYTLALAAGNWGGSDVLGKVTGTGTSTLTVISDQYASLIFTDSAANTHVTLNNSSANAYADSFSITLDDSPANPGLAFNGTSGLGGNRKNRGLRHGRGCRDPVD